MAVCILYISDSFGYCAAKVDPLIKTNLKASLDFCRIVLCEINPSWERRHLSFYCTLGLLALALRNDDVLLCAMHTTICHPHAHMWAHNGRGGAEQLIPRRGSTSAVWSWFGWSDLEQICVICRMCVSKVKTTHGNTTNLFKSPDKQLLAGVRGKPENAGRGNISYNKLSFSKCWNKSTQLRIHDAFKGPESSIQSWTVNAQSHGCSMFVFTHTFPCPRDTLCWAPVVYMHRVFPMDSTLWGK